MGVVHVVTSSLSSVQAAIEYKLKQLSVAKEALTDMPPRADEELDPVRCRTHTVPVVGPTS